MNAGWAVREDWAAANLASFSNGFEKLKTVGDKLQEHSKKAQSTLGLLTPMIEDAFELKDKSQAQREMERWSAERTRERDQTRHAAKPRRFSAPIDTASPTPQPAANQSAAAQEQTLQEPSASASQEPHRTADAMTVHEADAPEVVEELCEPDLVVHLEEPEEASMQDIVILQQRMQLEQLRRDKSTAEHERESLRSQVASLQRSSKSGSPSHTSCEAGEMSGDSLSGSSSSSISGRARGEVLKPFLQKSLRTLKAAGVGQRRTLALGVLILGTLALVFRMLTRVDRESMPDTEWDLEIDHSEMQRLVAALTADKAHAALRGGLATARGNGTMALDRDLVSVKTILNDLHRKSLKNHGHAATQLVRDNLRLESELRQLRSQIASLRGRPSSPANDRQGRKEKGWQPTAATTAASVSVTEAPAATAAKLAAKAAKYASKATSVATKLAIAPHLSAIPPHLSATTTAIAPHLSATTTETGKDNEDTKRGRSPATIAAAISSGIALWGRTQNSTETNVNESTGLWKSSNSSQMVIIVNESFDLQKSKDSSEGVHQKGLTSGKISGLQLNLNQNPDDHEAKTNNSTAPRKSLILDTVSGLHKSGDTSRSLPTNPLNYTVTPEVAPAPAYYSIVAPIQHTKKARGGETAGSAQKEKLGAKSQSTR